MIQKILSLFTFGILIFGAACNSTNIDTDKYYLKPITVKDFKHFVETTDYVTDAEKYGWSIVQKNVLQLKELLGVCPMG